MLTSLVIAILTGIAAASEPTTEPDPVASPPSPQSSRTTPPSSPGPWPESVPDVLLALGPHHQLSVSLMGQLAASGVFHASDPPIGDIQIRRLRADSQLFLADDHLRVRVNLNLAPRALELIETWVEGRVRRTALRVGVLKVPFTRYRDGSFASLSLVEWSPVTRAFGSERQVGAMLMTEEAGGWHGALSLTQGQSTRTSHGQGIADVLETSSCGWATMTGPPCPLQGVAPELVVRAGWASPSGSATDPFDRQGGALRGAWTASAAVDTSPDPDRDMAARLALEGSLAVSHVVVHAAVYGAWFVAEDGWRPGLLGWRGELTWSPHRHVGVAVRASSVFSLPALTQRAPHAGPWSTLEAIAGLTIPIIGDEVRWQVDGGWIRTTSGLLADQGIVRTMLQAGF